MPYADIQQRDKDRSDRLNRKAKADAARLRELEEIGHDCTGISACRLQSIQEPIRNHEVTTSVQTQSDTSSLRSGNNTRGIKRGETFSAAETCSSDS